jgi:glutaredoxin-related protein
MIIFKNTSAEIKRNSVVVLLKTRKQEPSSGFGSTIQDVRLKAITDLIYW